MASLDPENLFSLFQQSRRKLIFSPLSAFVLLISITNAQGVNTLTTPNVIGGPAGVNRVLTAKKPPTDAEKIATVRVLFDYAATGNFPGFLAGFAPDASYEYMGGPMLPWTGPFTGQDSTLHALGIYGSLFNFTLDIGSLDIAVSPSSGKVIGYLLATVTALDTGKTVAESCALYLELRDDLLVTRVVESCNSLAEFLALQPESCVEELERCAKRGRGGLAA